MGYLVIVRHGETDENRDDTVFAYANPKLTALGKRQAKATGKYLSKYFTFNTVISSNLQRAIDTANIIAKEVRFKKAITIDEDVREGKEGPMLTSKKIDDLESLPNGKKIKRIFDAGNALDIMEIIGPNNKNYKLFDEWSRLTGSETSDDMRVRCKRFYNRIKNNKGNTLIVSHGGWIVFFIELLSKVNTYGVGN